MATPSDPRLPREIDHGGVQSAASELIVALGADVDSEALQETPVASPTLFRATYAAEGAGRYIPHDDGRQMIVARAIPFHRVHAPPTALLWLGANRAPQRNIIGLSKFGRVVELSPATSRSEH